MAGADTIRSCIRAAVRSVDPRKQLLGLRMSSELSDLERRLAMAEAEAGAARARSRRVLP